MGLSERRVKSAAGYLVGKGVQKSKIKTIVYLFIFLFNKKEVN
jgi:outer membrane protein OmpA-like peptidoglycan-associated protein